MEKPCTEEHSMTGGWARAGAVHTTWAGQPGAHTVPMNTLHSKPCHRMPCTHRCTTPQHSVYMNTLMQIQGYHLVNPPLNTRNREARQGQQNKDWLVSTVLEKGAGHSMGGASRVASTCGCWPSAQSARQNLGTV